jgi:signal transduction histidine kinase
MQPTTHRVTAREHWLDASLIVLLAGVSVLWSGSLPMNGKPYGEVINDFGSAEAWQIHLVWWYLAAVPAAVAIVLRHRWPLTATLLAAGSASVHLLDAVLRPPPMDFAVLIVMYTLACSAHPRRTVITVLVAAESLLYLECVVAEAGLLIGGPGNRKPVVTDYDRLAKTVHAFVHEGALPGLLNAAKAAAVPALLLAATWAVADSARTRRAHLATLEARAQDLEREQRQRTALAVAAERGRITRELHDVVAHGLSVMVIQAQGAKAMLVRQPERTGTALTNIVTTGRASLAEMRRLLGLERTEQVAELAPQPSLALLPKLVDRVRDSGTPVDFHISGEPATLPGVVELSAYRVVQEALTNTLKHATPGTACTVTLDFAATSLGIRVTDRGGPVAPPSFGNGLRGLTERVHALGGELSAGPMTGGGFQVSARLPIGGIDPADFDPAGVGPVGVGAAGVGPVGVGPVGVGAAGTGSAVAAPSGGRV